MKLIFCKLLFAAFTELWFDVPSIFLEIAEDFDSHSSANTFLSR